MYSIVLYMLRDVSLETLPPPGDPSGGIVYLRIVTGNGGNCITRS